MVDRLTLDPVEQRVLGALLEKQRTPFPLAPSPSSGSESESELLEEVSLAVTGKCGCERDPFM